MSLRVLLITLICLTATMPMDAASSISTTGNDQAELKRFLKRNCYECHRGKDAEGGLDMSALSTDLSHKNTLKHWVHILDRVSSGEMPPEDADELNEGDKQSFLTHGGQWVRTFETHKNKNKGRVQGRRLTNVQLERTLHDLLGIDIPLASKFPQGLGSKRFETIADGQPMSRYHLERHLEVIDLALDNAYERALKHAPYQITNYDAKALSRRPTQKRCREPEYQNDTAVTWPTNLPFVGRMPRTTAKDNGWVRMTFEASAIRPPQTGGIWCSVRTGKAISTASLLEWVGSFEATPKPQQWTFEAWLPKEHMIEIRPNDNTLKRGRFKGGQIDTGFGEQQKLSGLAMHWMKVERIHYGPDQRGMQNRLFGHLEVKRHVTEKPIYKSWYNKKAKKKQKKLIRTDRNVRFEVIASDPLEDLNRLLTDFASRAYRRPASHQDVLPYISLSQQALDEGLAFTEALRRGYRAILCSPRFLYFYEKPGKLDDYAVASRLSYFLWQSPPDKVLMDLAAARKLNKSWQVRQQLERMLKHPRGKRFIKDLSHEWLDLKDINFTVPDRRLFPKFDPVVQQSMVEETHHYLQHVLDKNLSVTHLIDSDFTFLNSRLARYYNLPSIKGDDMRLVKLPENSPRGGLLGQGAILKVTANGTTTSPVVRGVWMLEKLLGEHVPAPPPNVPAIEPDIRGAKSIRDMLEKHRSIESCAACHKKIDPPGFALENFDPSGAWRTRYGKSKKSVAVKSGYTLANGKKFGGVKEYKKIVTSRPRTLARNLVDQLLTFGTGAPIGYSDRGEVERIVKQSEKSNYGFATLLNAAVSSKIFLYK